MFSTLFASKRNTASSKSSNINSKKMFCNLLDLLLAELDINLSNRSMSNQLTLKENMKVVGNKKSDTFSDDLQSIALNQIAYSKLMAEKLQKTSFKKKQGKSILLHS
ncbi:hypothetical protein SAMN03080594_11610 [Arenibacter palladensis]|uniref:Uncharacterized protein n=1 Tax=Arenibacter palladensis TaxID=237373 RepID=A0A1M5HM37_9FLAO|nr:hypothetical protein [Arenibacter palladensis]SHG17013.1 hypothetical protein SAMN03080594_11610 [Arenibacter palladensis]